jgi:hypothetical protein
MKEVYTMRTVFAMAVGVGLITCTVPWTLEAHQSRGCQALQRITMLHRLSGGAVSACATIGDA